VIALLPTGCSRKVSESDIAGKYNADYGFAKETLELTSNHTFHQEIKVTPPGKTASANGTWRFDREDSDLYFSDDFLVVADGFGKLIPDFDRPSKKAIAILPVRSRFGHVEIAGDPAVSYKKVE
jgi:hypothetical protein